MAALRHFLETKSKSSGTFPRVLGEDQAQLDIHKGTRDRHSSSHTASQSSRREPVERPGSASVTASAAAVNTTPLVTRERQATPAIKDLDKTTPRGRMGHNPRKDDATKKGRPSEGQPLSNKSPESKKRSVLKTRSASKTRSVSKTNDIAENWSPNIIDAFRKGDAKALKAALGGVETSAPKSLQEQIDLEYPPSRRPYGAWGVPLPTLLRPETDIHKDMKMVRQYLGDLILVYDKTTHSVRVSLPEREQGASPIESIPGAMIAKFSRATAKVWKWIEAMKESRKVIPIGEWICSQLEAKKEKYKAAIYEYAETLDIQTQNRCIRKKSVLAQSPVKMRKASGMEKEHDGQDTMSSDQDNTTARPRSSKRHRKE